MIFLYVLTLLAGQEGGGALNFFVCGYVPCGFPKVGSREQAFF